MKVFACYAQGSWSGGMIIACGNSVEEAFKAFIEDSAYNYVKDNNYDDKPICTSDSYYPLGYWFEMTELTADCDKPKVLYENSYFE